MTAPISRTPNLRMGAVSKQAARTETESPAMKQPAAGALDAFVSRASDKPAVTLEGPGVMNPDAHKTAFKWVKGDLFVNGVGPDDVVQGEIGDCYLLAAASAVAVQEPELIEDAFRDNGNGTYDVRFHDLAGNTETVTIDGRLPRSTLLFGGSRYAEGRDRRELWGPLLEKAYAVWQGDYEAIGNGGVGGRAMAAITGRPSDYEMIGTLSPDSLFMKMKEAFADKRAMVAGTPAATDRDIVPSHAYSVLEVGEDAQGRYVKLRNPWGHGEPVNFSADDGIFRMSMADFSRSFFTLAIN